MVNLELKELLEKYVATKYDTVCTKQEQQRLINEGLITAWNGFITKKGKELLETKE